MLGATEQCNVCVGENCCAEAEALEANPSQSTYNVLSDCAVGQQGEGPCSIVCYTSICNSDYGYVLFQQCAECLDSNCCDPFDVCNADAACNSCLWYFDEQTCCNNGEYLAWDDCSNLHCMDACGGGYCGYGG
jgi:hypothetical protein